MRIYSVENLNKAFEEPTIVNAENAKEAIKKAFGIANVKQDKYGNILVRGIIDTRYGGAYIRTWVYKEEICKEINS